MTFDQLWMVVAAGMLGRREVPGPGAAAWLKSLWLGLKGGAWFWGTVGKGDDSKLPWCGAFVAHCLQSAGLAIAERYASALAWAQWGIGLSAPAVGCVVVFNRDGGGHVGFVAGVDPSGRLLVLGGNQGDAVSIAPFDVVARPPVAYRWPPGVKAPAAIGFKALPVFAVSGATSTNEA